MLDAVVVVVVVVALTGLVAGVAVVFSRWGSAILHPRRKKQLLIAGSMLTLVGGVLELAVGELWGGLALTLTGLGYWTLLPLVGRATAGESM